MRIHLALCPSWDLDNPPLGIASVGAALREAGHEVRLFDFNIESFHAAGDSSALWEMTSENRRNWCEPDRFDTLLRGDLAPQVQSWADRLLEDEPDAVGFTVYSSSKFATLTLAEEIKRRRPETRIILGGPHFPSDFATRGPLHFVDDIALATAEANPETTPRVRLAVEPLRDEADQSLKLTLRFLGSDPWVEVRFGEMRVPDLAPMVEDMSALLTREQPYPIRIEDPDRFAALVLDVERVEGPHGEYADDLEIRLEDRNGGRGAWRPAAALGPSGTRALVLERAALEGALDPASGPWDIVLRLRPRASFDQTRCYGIRRLGWRDVDGALHVFHPFDSFHCVRRGDLDTMQSDMFDVIRHPAVDGIVTGEGEVTARELFERLDAGEEISDLPGAFSRREGIVLSGGIRPLVADLDSLPHPDFTDFDLGLYPSGKIPISLSRGCVYKCKFCRETKWWTRYRFRSAESVHRELLHHVETLMQPLGLSSLDFNVNDSLLNGNMKMLERLCEMINETELEVRGHRVPMGQVITWGGMARLHSRMTPPLLAKMREAGCQVLSFGLESGSERLLKEMRKETDLGLAAGVLRASHAVGIRTAVNLIVGYPTESWRDFGETLWFVLRNRRALDEVGTGYPLILTPGSDLFDRAAEYGLHLTDNPLEWTDASGKNDLRLRLRRLEILQRYVDWLGLNPKNIVADLSGERSLASA